MRAWDMMLDEDLKMPDRDARRLAGPGGARLRAGVAALCAVLALAACTSDQSGVRDWSIQAREVVLPPAVAPAALASPDAERAEVASVLRESAGAWLAVLAALADDATPPDDSAPIEQRALRLAGTDAAASAAAVNLARAAGFVAQRGWGAAHLAYAVDYGDPFFQAVVAALARQAADAAPAAAPTAAAPTAAAPTAAAPAAARGTMARDARQMAVARVGAGHALLVERTFILGQSDTGRMMRAEASELRRLMAVSGTAP
jgi:hypothetical protein